MTNFKKAFDELERGTSETPNAAEVPAGYVLKRESKTKRTSLVMRPSYFERLEDLAAKRGEKRNELLNQIIEEDLNEHDK